MFYLKLFCTCIPFILNGWKQYQHYQQETISDNFVGCSSSVSALYSVNFFFIVIIQKLTPHYTCKRTKYMASKIKFKANLIKSFHLKKGRTGQLVDPSTIKLFLLIVFTLHCFQFQCLDYGQCMSLVNSQLSTNLNQYMYTHLYIGLC